MQHISVETVEPCPPSPSAVFMQRVSLTVEMKYPHRRSCILPRFGLTPKMPNTYKKEEIAVYVTKADEQNYS